jgi:hypothetical protein
MFGEVGNRPNVNADVLSVDDASGNDQSTRMVFYKETLHVETQAQDPWHVEHRMTETMHNQSGPRYAEECGNLTHALNEDSQEDQQNIDKRLLHKDGSQISRRYTYKDDTGKKEVWKIDKGQVFSEAQLKELKRSGLYRKIFKASKNLRSFPRTTDVGKANLGEFEEGLWKHDVEIPCEYVSGGDRGEEIPGENASQGGGGEERFVNGRLMEPLYGEINSSSTYRVGVKRGAALSVVAVSGSDLHVLYRVASQATTAAVQTQQKKWKHVTAIYDHYSRDQLWRALGTDSNGLRTYESLIGTNRQENYNKVSLKM